MPYAIMRFNKMKGGPAEAMEAHHERKKEKYESNPDIDLERVPQNYHIITPKTSYHQEIQSRIENAKCRVRKDSIKFVDTLITASPEFFKKCSPKKAKAFFKSAIEFLAKEVGRNNIFSAVVHMDERTPHMHICFVPLTEDNRLCAKEIIGNRPKLVEWQDKFHDHMVEKFPELERGESAEDTKRKHIPIQLFKQATTLTAEMEGIKKIINNMGVLNIGKSRDDLLKQLSKFIPRVHSYLKQINSIKKGHIELKQEIKILEQKSENLKSGSFDRNLELAKSKADFHNLEKSYNDLRSFLNGLPGDMRDDLFELYKVKGLDNAGKDERA